MDQQDGISAVVQDREVGPVNIKDFGYDGMLQLHFCKLHNSYYKTKSLFREHVRKIHNLTLPEVERVMTGLDEEKKKCRTLTRREEQLRQIYLKYDKDREGLLVKHGKYPQEILPCLDIPEVSTSWQCQVCFLIIPNKQKVRAHEKECKGECIEVRSQSLYIGKNLCPFRVREEKKMHESEARHWLVERFTRVDKLGCADSTESDVIEVDALVKTLRCSEHLQGFSLSMEQAWHLVRWREDYMDMGLEKKVFRIVGEYLERARSLFKKNVYAKRHQLFGQFIHVALTASTTIDYHKKITSLIYFIHNIVVLYYREDFKEVFSRRLGEAVITKYNRFLCAVKEPGCGRNDLGELHNLLFTLFLTEERGLSNIVPLYITCRTVFQDNARQKEYHFGRGSDISHYLAALLYLTQCILITETYGDHQASRGVVDEGFTEQPSQNRHSVVKWEEVCSLCGNDNDCGASYVRYCMDLCNQMRNNEAMQVRFVRCEKHTKCALVDGQELALSSIGSAVKEMQGDLRKRIDEKLLYGFWSVLNGEFWSVVEDFSDNFLDRRVGFWFGLHPANQDAMKSWRQRFISHLITNGDGFIGSQKGEVNEQKRRIFLGEAEDLVKNIFWLMQMTGGGPARVSEIQKCQFRNSTCTGRHMFLEQGRIMYVLFGHKGRDKTALSKPIARFPDYETSKIILCYLIFIRPLDDILARGTWLKGMGNNVDQPAEKDCLDTLVFCSGRRVVNEDILRRAFAKTMQDKTGERWSVIQYRQYHTGVIKAFANRECVEGETDGGEEITNILHHQSGHGVSIANETYGVAEVNMKKLDSVTMHNWRLASKKWQKMIGVGEDIVESNNGIVENAEIGLPREQNVRKGLVIENKGVVTGDSHWNAALKNLEKRFESVEEVINNLSRTIESWSENAVGDRGGIGPHLRTGSTKASVLFKSTGLEEEESGVMLKRVGRETVLQSFRECVGKSTAMFRDKYQEMCIMASSNAECDGLFILPTGSGKSLTFMTQATVRKDLLCIVIVPLLALKNDLMQKCVGKGISVVDWKDRFVHGVQVIFCSSEHVVSNDYGSFVKENCKTGRLHAIYMDEAHLLLQWMEFRPVFRRIANRIRPDNASVPLFGMTATCPPKMEPWLKRVMGLRDNSSVIRQSCTRSNIGYSVLRFETKDVTRSLLKEIFSGPHRNCLITKPREKLRIVVYCLTRSQADEVYNTLHDIPLGDYYFGKYHAGMTKLNREKTVSEWIAAEEVKTLVIVATSAFGCGVDFPDISQVIHYGVPRSIMGFLQESGRAGRDGQPASSVVMVPIDNDSDNRSSQSSYHSRAEDSSDIEPMEQFITEAERWSEQVDDSHTFGSLEHWVGLGYGSCRRIPLDEYCDGVASKKNCHQRKMVPCDLCMSSGVRKEEDVIIDLDENMKDYDGDVEIVCHNIKPRNQRKRKSCEQKVEDGDRRCLASNSNTPKAKLGGMYRKNLLTEFSPRPKKMSLTRSVSQSPSQSVSYTMVLDIIKRLNGLCALCSVWQGKKVQHEYGKQDQQKCDRYKKHCIGCGSGKHGLSQCFSKKYRFSGEKWCWSCSMKTHRNELLHEVDVYGNSKCPVKNSHRILIAGFEHPSVRLRMNEEYPSMKEIPDAESFVAFLRESDEEDSTWFADVLHWFENNILS